MRHQDFREICKYKINKEEKSRLIPSIDRVAKEIGLEYIPYISIVLLSIEEKIPVRSMKVNWNRFPEELSEESLEAIAKFFEESLIKGIKIELAKIPEDKKPKYFSFEEVEGNSLTIYVA